MQVGSLQGGGALCSPLRSHLLNPKRNAHMRSARLPIMASSIRRIPTEQEVKQIALMIAANGAYLLRRCQSSQSVFN